MTKEILRKLMKAKLSLIDEKSFTEMSNQVSVNLALLNSSLNVIQNKMVMGVFAPIAKEPLWYLGQPSELDELMAFPAYSADAGKMIFRAAQLRDLIKRSDFGFEILGPPVDAPEVNPGMILIPGLAFSEKGDRLGRGKGFYDKYLAHYHGIKVGICFFDQLQELLPTEEHDVALDYIVTDKKIIKCKLV